MDAEWRAALGWTVLPVHDKLGRHLSRMSQGSLYCDNQRLYIVRQTTTYVGKQVFGSLSCPKVVSGIVCMAWIAVVSHYPSSHSKVSLILAARLLLMVSITCFNINKSVKQSAVCFANYQPILSDRTQGYEAVQHQNSHAADEPGQVFDDKGPFGFLQGRKHRDDAQAICAIAQHGQGEHCVGDALCRLPLELQQKTQKKKMFLFCRSE